MNISVTFADYDAISVSPQYIINAFDIIGWVCR